MPDNRNSRNYRRKSSDHTDSPVSFRDGQPVYRDNGNPTGKPEGNRKPYGKPDAERKPYGKPDAERKPYGKPDAERKPYGKPDAERKPYGKPDAERKPYGKPESERKPYGNPTGKPNGNPEAERTYYKKSDNAEGRFDKNRRNQRNGEAFHKRDADRQETSLRETSLREAGVREAPVQADELPYLVMGRNAVREALKSGRSIDKLLVSKEPDGSLRELMNLARDRGVRVDEVNREKLDELCMPFGHGGKTGNHQGAVAQVPGVEYCEIADMLHAAKEKNERPFLILLDGIEDPHNLGSIIRSAVCAGAHGVILPRRRAVGVTAAACKASAGAVEHCRIARVANITNALMRLKDEGLWIAGADMTGMPMGRARMEGALALVIGSEGEGLSRLVKEKCDFLVSIPMQGPLDSLNASVAAAILMFEKRRQDGLVKQ